ncbi:VWA domain-containing protein [Moorena sp. SIO3H5]|uniref:VWA domain-containing protein n=1 Tax=Moorena sp. SIO3H5 TaxID=2607834 RepID=UPI0013B61766|nr:VWA domain-containing protein [Moorena sp. SIO3H5]NEO69254.1 VWA domain-containing protein [Moorena sp. SIO3H5]
MTNAVVQDYLQNHYEEKFLEYLEKKSEQTELWLGITYEDLDYIINKIKDLLDYQVRLDIIKIIKRLIKWMKNEPELSIEEQILLTLLHFNQKFDLDLLSRIFKISESTVYKIYKIWVSVLYGSELEYCLFNNFKDIKSSLDIKIGENTITDDFQALESLEQEISVFKLHSYDDKTSKFSINKSIRIPRSTCLNKNQNIDQNSAGIINEINPVLSHKSSNLKTSYLSLGRKLLNSSSRFTPNLLPLNTNHIKLLPHDGLFIRRNNQFGTRLTVGIKDLIEKGVLVDQTTIRFDDFVASNSEGVPSPQAGQSMAVSYGITPITLSQKRDKRATHYLEIALKASDVAPTGHKKIQSPAVNYIFVIDTSYSMQGEKLDAVKTSIQELFKSMREDDVIGIIEFDNRPNTLLKATPIGKLDIAKFSKILSNMTATGGTDINVAISYGIDEISRYGNSNTLNHIYLFSDGNPTSGETEWIKIRQNIDRKTRGDIRLSTFAFGSDANIKELEALAGLTGGKSTFVTDIDDIKISLDDELSRREHLAAINIQIKVDIDRDIDIPYLYGHDLITDPASRAAVLDEAKRVGQQAEEEFEVTPQPDLITEEKGIRIFVPDLAVGETYWIVFELAIPEEKTETSIGQATVQYVDTFARQNQKPEFDLSFSGDLPTNLVVEHALALWTSEVAFYALDDLYQKDFDTANKRIDHHVNLLKDAKTHLSSEAIADDMIILNKFRSLAGNLGKPRLISDVTPQGYHTFFVHELSSFGQVRNGFNRVNYSYRI